MQSKMQDSVQKYERCLDDAKKDKELCLQRAYMYAGDLVILNAKEEKWQRLVAALRKLIIRSRIMQLITCCRAVTLRSIDAAESNRIVAGLSQRVLQAETVVTLLETSHADILATLTCGHEDSLSQVGFCEARIFSGICTE